MNKKQEKDPKTKASDRFELFESAALEKLRSGGSITNPTFYLPLPTKLVAIAASTTLLAGVIWSFLARIPILVDGIGAFIPETPIITEVAEVSGTVNYLVPGHSNNLLNNAEKNNILSLERFWNNSQTYQNFLPSYQKLTNLSFEASQVFPSQKISLNNLILSKKNSDNDFLFYKKGKFITQVFNKILFQDIKHSFGKSKAKINLFKLDSDLKDENQTGIIKSVIKKDSSPEAIILRNNLKNALDNFITKSYSISPKGGMYILNIYARPGSNVKKGDGLYTYTSEKPKLPKIIPVFVNSASLQQIVPGQRVTVFPKGISRSRFGGIQGEVIQVSKFPITLDKLANYIGTRQLAKNISLLEPELYMLNVQLSIKSQQSCNNHESAECYLFTSGRTPPFPVRLGALAVSEISVERKAPIEFLIPGTRQFFDFGDED